MADFTQDLRRNSVTWLWADPHAFNDATDIKLAELNSVNENLILDITCALDEDTTTFTLGSSDMDERLSFCDGVGTSRPTSINPELTLGIYRDEDRTANGVFNKVLNRFKHVGQSFYIVQRVGPQDSGSRNGVAAKTFEGTDDIRVGLFTTDYPIDTLAEEDPALMTITPLLGGFLAWNVSPTA